MESGPVWFSNIILKLMHPPTWVLGALVILGIVIIITFFNTLRLELKTNSNDNGISSVVGIFVGVVITFGALVLINLPTLVIITKP